MMPTLSMLRTLGQARLLKRVGLVALLLLAIVMLVRGFLGPSITTDLIEKRDFVQTVVASGHVESPHRVELGTQLTGTVKRVPVLEGQTVQQTQILIELENAELQAALKQAELNVVQASAKIRQLNSNLGKVAPVGVGVLWAFMPCGLLYSALMVAALTGNVLEGAFTMACFALGSGVSLGFAPWMLLKLKSLGDGAWGIRLAGLALVTTSSWALWLGLAHHQAPWCVT
jgi:cytochrome c biogenesis protein CcdA